MKAANRILGEYGTTIFEVMSRLAEQHKAINLGQGFPDGNGPDDVRAAAVRALEAGPNQYPSMMGTPALRQAVGQDQAVQASERGLRLHGFLQADRVQGTEALANLAQGLIAPARQPIRGGFLEVTGAVRQHFCHLLP